MKQYLDKINLEVKNKFNITYNNLEELKKLCSDYENIALIKQKYKKLKRQQYLYY